MREHIKKLIFYKRLTEFTDGGGYPAYGLMAAAAAAANAGLYRK